MKKCEIEHIRKNKRGLIDNTKCTERLLADLSSCNILSEEDIQRIRAEVYSKTILPTKNHILAD